MVSLERQKKFPECTVLLLDATSMCTHVSKFLAYDTLTEHPFATTDVRVTFLVGSTTISFSSESWAFMHPGSCGKSFLLSPSLSTPSWHTGNGGIDDADEDDTTLEDEDDVTTEEADEEEEEIGVDEADDSEDDTDETDDADDDDTDEETDDADDAEEDDGTFRTKR
jgi:hypothetical protein